MENVVNPQIKGYELRERIGAGGFGAVYRAYQSTVGREVAIKVILPRFANHPDFIRRFETEAQIIARLEHWHIVPLYDFWRDPDGAYLVMRWLRGGNLRNALEKGAFELSATALLLDQITSALAVAHRSRVIHRDLKPANILLDEDGNAYLGDFGIAKDLASQLDQITQADVVIGSPDYLSPEQARSEPVTPQTDIYSLGVVLYELLTGEHPFPNLSAVERMYKHLNEPLPLITKLPADIVDRVNTVVRIATAKNPAQRYKDAVAMATAFREAAGLNNQTNGHSIVEMLTMREQEVLQQIIEGRSNKEIAQNLFITVTTVKWYVNQIYAKLGVRNRVQAIVRARELKLVVSESTSMIVPIDTSDGSSLKMLAAENPYKGLRAFQAADNQDFFGREALTTKLVKHLDAAQTNSIGIPPVEKSEASSNRFLAVIGPSGSGKSSLVRAGLIPALWRGEVPGSEKWFIAEMLPGAHPIDELEVALIRIAATPGGNLHEQLTRDDRGLLRAASLILPDDGSELLLVIDQFEEVFTLVEDEARRLHFLNTLVAAVSDPRSRIRVIITLRADFYDRPLYYPQFGELVRSCMETVLPLSAVELERAIARPAEQQGVKFEDGLVAKIVAEVNYQPGALPLLQYALTELFEQRRERLLTHEGYQSIGGTVGALAKRADEIYDSFDNVSKETARQVFLRLVTLGEGVEDTRRRVARAELLSITDKTEIVEEILDTYTAHRLLSLDNDPGTRTPTVEVAHEAILREWERLRRWLNDSRDEIRLQRQLATMAAEWRAANQEASYLAAGVRLEQFERWVQDTKLVLTPPERAYLNASLAERERQSDAEKLRMAHEAQLERRSQRFLRALIAVFATAAVLATTLSVVAVRQTAVAEQNLTLSTSREMAAASVSNLTVDPELSLLLALRAVKATYDVNKTTTVEAVEALHRSVATAHARLSLKGHTGGITDLAYSPDGTRLATSSLDGTVIIWDVVTGKPVLILDERTAVKGITDDRTNHELYNLAYSSDGTRIVTGSRDGVTVVWDAVTGNPLKVFPGSDLAFQVFRVAYSPDGTKVAAYSTSISQGAVVPQSNDTDATPDHWRVKVWDLASGKEVLSVSSLIGGGSVSGNGTWGGLAFSPDSKLLALAGNNDAEIWSLSTHGKLLTLTGHTQTMLDLAFSSDGKRLTTGSSDTTIKIWDISTPLSLGLPTTREALTLSGTGSSKATYGITSFALRPDDRWLVTGSLDAVAQIWDAASGSPIFSISGYAGSVTNFALSPDGQTLATVSSDAIARLWDMSPGKELFSFQLDKLGGTNIVYSPDGTRIAYAGGFNSSLIVDALTGYNRVVIGRPGENEVTIVYSPDGKHVATAGNPPTIWDAATGKELLTLIGHDGDVDIVAYSPDGRLIASGGADQKVRIWDAASGALLRTMESQQGRIHCMDFSPDNVHLVTGGDDRKLIVWDATTGEKKLTVLSALNVIAQVSYSPDGKHFASADFSATASIWDSTTGNQVMSLGGNPVSVGAVEFSPDGKMIVTTGGSIAKLWDAQTGRELLTLHSPANTSFAYAMFSPDSQHIAIVEGQGASAYTLSIPELIGLGQARVTRSFTTAECQRYLHVETCPAN